MKVNLKKLIPLILICIKDVKKIVKNGLRLET